MDQPTPTTMPSLLFLLLLLLLLFNGPPLSSSLHLPLIHRHSFLSPNATQIQRLHDLIRTDHIRLQTIISHRRMINIPPTTTRQMRSISSPSPSPSASLPISSGSYASIGQYFVSFRVGSPSQKFMLVADTGSDLTWMNCRYRCRKCPRRIGGRRFFNAGRSKSFKTIPCSTPMCQNLPFSLARCPTQRSPCHYDYRYTDGSSAKGIFANETVTVGLTNGRQLRLPHVVVGCSSSLSGSTFRASDGVLGLGYSNYSFVAQASKQLGGKFSYCLVDHLSPKNVSSYLTLGGHSNNVNYKFDLLGNMRYTKLVLDVLPALYPVNIHGISIGGVMLKIPLPVWDLNDGGGAIVDSGTSLTFLAKPAYKAVMTALKLPLKRFKRVEVKPFQFCFSSVGFNETLVPKLVVHFADSARFEPPVKSYVIDVSKGVKCLGFMENSWPDISIIGNIMQQNFMWEFDIVGRRLGFAPSTCRTTTSH